MGIQSSISRGLWFEDFEIGLNLVSPGRTITETDVVSFAGLSGDYNQIHTDVEFSKTTHFGRRLAHGLLGLSVASGLVAQTGVLEGTILAFREIEHWKFIKPVFIGDTIHAEMSVKETKAVPRLGGGLVVIQLNVINQDDEVVMAGDWNAIIRSKPSEE